MDAALISALSALAGSVVGGLTSGLANWVNQRAQTRSGIRTHEIQRREELYGDFITAASKAYGEAITSDTANVHHLVALYAMISTMRTVSSVETVRSAEHVMQITVATYRAPNRDVLEYQDLVRRGDTIDPLKAFSEAARAELRTLARS